MCAWQSGGGSAPPAELAYAEQTNNQTIAVANDTPIAGLTVTVDIPAGVKYCVEFYCSEVDEDSGSTAGDLVSIAIEGLLSTVVATGRVYQAVGGVGSALFIRSADQTSSGGTTTRLAVVSNLTNTANGAILSASSNNPMYIRIVRLS